MIDVSSARRRYEEKIISGRPMTYSDPADKAACARIILRYAIELLEWTPEYAAAHFNDSTAHSLGLTRILKNIPVPDYVPAGDRHRYMIQRAYLENAKIYP